MKTLKSPILWLFILTIALLLFTALAPAEKTLGTDARVIYLHGAWVWVALICFLAAAAFGVVALISRRENLHCWSRSIGRTALTYWVTFFPLSLYLMHQNWNGLFLDEPRWQVPFTFAVSGLLLQLGLSLQKPVWASLANVAFAIALFAGMNGMENILHPASPIFESESVPIKVFFGILLILLVLSAWQVARIWYRSEKDRPGIM